MKRCRKSLNLNFLSWISKLIYPLYSLYLPIAQSVRSNRFLIRCLFKVRLHKRDKVSWDFTTLALKHALRKGISKNTKTSVLEIGIGQAALLCIYLAREAGVKPDGVDIIVDRVKHSIRIAQYNSVPIRLWQSDFFENVENKYDLIFWNASYIPTGFGRHYRLSQREEVGSNRAWDGGSDGTAAIKRFLSQAPHYLKPEGKILLGVNRFYVRGKNISPLIQTNSLEVIDHISRFLNPSVVYVLHQGGSENEK